MTDATTERNRIIAAVQATTAYRIMRPDFRDAIMAAIKGEQNRDVSAGKLLAEFVDAVADDYAKGDAKR